MTPSLATCYRVGIFGYAAGMMVAVLGGAPVGLLLLAAASFAAVELFVIRAGSNPPNSADWSL